MTATLSKLVQIITFQVIQFFMYFHVFSCILPIKHQMIVTYPAISKKHITKKQNRSYDVLFDAGELEHGQLIQAAICP